ncbi:class I SAM-dependent methyltransferase [Nocardioides donggukensis]|uniref:Class I SAM-dependent methyltransferase n=1 Tax=Nocardioides donggukensis TaxID=2774019 RepID=A0A927KA39_9ACTN|nr:class I SAM-dependent methyltransferase [Nocardioides donggukensis]MBD8870430.1 class I SAM-dependent methyltransferase [Nocardioides donggukensis]
MDAHSWDERYAASELVWSATPNRFVAGALADLPPGRAVDLAAGEGRNALWLASLGWEVTAVDFSAAGIEKGRELESGRPPERPVRWVCADVLTWSADEPVDLVVVAYLQLRSEQRREAVRRGFAALRPGGTFFLVAHDTTNLTEGTGGPQDASVLMTADDVLGDLADQAFRTVRAERVAREVPAAPAETGHGDAPSATAWDCLVHLVRD